MNYDDDYYNNYGCSCESSYDYDSEDDEYLCWSMYNDNDPYGDDE